MDPDPDADPDPAIFIIDLQDANKKLIKKKFGTLLFEGTFTSFLKDKSQKEVTKSRNQCFSDYFLLNDKRIRIHTLLLTNGPGSGFRRPKTTWIRWFRIRDTGYKHCHIGTERYCPARLDRPERGTLITIILLLTWFLLLQRYGDS
jgi:hypothetical protein